MTPASSTFRSSASFGPFAWALRASSGSLPAPGGRTEDLGGAGARRRNTEDRRDPRREAGVFPFVRPDGPREDDRMTITRDDATPPGPGASAARARVRRSHVPGDGTSRAAAVEAARKEMLSERRGRPLGRTRIGADVVCEALLRQGVDVFFGYPGGVVLPLYDVLGDYPEIRHILVRHEQGGAHAADGYARVTGKVGVCLGTSGPGATNLVTGLATAQLDSVPIVAITGNVPAALLGKDAFQEIDINGITLPMTKHNYLVRDPKDLPRVFAEAFHIARSGRPGPVHIDITKDALQQATEAQHPDDAEVRAGLPGFRPNLQGHFRQLKAAAAEIEAAKR